MADWIADNRPPPDAHSASPGEVLAALFAAAGHDTTAWAVLTRLAENAGLGGDPPHTPEQDEVDTDGAWPDRSPALNTNRTRPLTPDEATETTQPTRPGHSTLSLAADKKRLLADIDAATMLWQRTDPPGQRRADAVEVGVVEHTDDQTYWLLRSAADPATMLVFNHAEWQAHRDGITAGEYDI